MVQQRGGLRVEWLGRVAYADALVLQARAVEDRRQPGARDRLLLLEHPPVITLGRSAREANLLAGRESLAARGIEVHDVQRGGDVTYHAPGQLVGYLITNLQARGDPDVHRYVRSLEAGLMTAMAKLDLPCKRVAGRTGVFVDRRALARRRDGSDRGRERKIASIGVGIQRWVTLHGFALNVTIDLAGFDAIVPCGLDDIEMTSVAHELGEGRLGLDIRVREAVSRAFQAEFGPRCAEGPPG